MLSQMANRQEHTKPLGKPMKGSGAVSDEDGHGVGDRYSPSLAIVATGLFMSVAASLAGCGRSDFQCPDIFGIPTTSITYTPAAIHEVYIYNDFEVEIVTVPNAANDVSIDIAESMAGFLKVEHDDSGRLVFQLTSDECVSEAKVTITVPEPVRILESGSSSKVAADRMT